MAPLIELLVGTTRQARLADKPLAWIVDRLSRRDDLEIEIVDLRDHPLPFFEGPVAPIRAPREYPSEEVARLGRTFDRASGFLVLTGEYNHGYPAVLKNALDHFYVEFNRKPITFVGYGNVGGARAVEQLREVAVEFEMAPLRYAVHVLPDLLIEAIGTDEFTPELFAPLDARLEAAADDLVWWSNALDAARTGK
jgi:NAD(P)H-dependent FMN reductase